MDFKVAFIGAGGVGFTRTLLADLMSVPEFRDIRISFTDIDPHNLDMVTQLCQRDLEHNGIATRIHATTNRREALKDARYVINAARVGRLDAFETDIEIPLRYGVDQCVGDTLAPGGIMYGQRGIPAILDFCGDIREVAEKGAILFNYGNPNAMLTWAANKYGGVKTIGLCHGVISTQLQFCQVFGLEDVKELDVICAGINHQTWYISVKHKGRDVLNELLPAYINNENTNKKEKVRIDVLRNFGYYSTESNGHLSEYLAWYRKRPDRLHEFVDTDAWFGGETGGYLRICREGSNWFETDFPNMLKEPPREYVPAQRSQEHGSYIVEGLETGRLYRGYFNVMNQGCITNLPAECVVEVPGYVDANGINIPRVGELPLGCAAICSQSAWVQRLAVEAAISGDIRLLRQAMLMDPLTGAVCVPDEVMQMVDEMLIAQAEWLPQYQREIELAKSRIRQRREEGSFIPPRDYAGIRVKERSVDELRVNADKAREAAAATDKTQV